MNIRTDKLGRRVELRQERHRLVAECDGLRTRLLLLLPSEEDVDVLDTEAILNSALALKQSHDELAGINRKIHILTAELGD